MQLFPVEGSSSNYTRGTTWSDAGWLIGSGLTIAADLRRAYVRAVDQFVQDYATANGGRTMRAAPADSTSASTAAPPAGGSGSPRVTVKSEIRLAHRADFGPTIQLLPEGVQGRMSAFMAEVLQSGQQLIQCRYEPQGPTGTTEIQVFNFWYGNPPAKIREMVTATTSRNHGRNPFRRYSVNAVTECPESPDIAAALHQTGM